MASTRSFAARQSNILGRHVADNLARFRYRLPDGMHLPVDTVIQFTRLVSQFAHFARGHSPSKAATIAAPPGKSSTPASDSKPDTP